MIFSFLSGDIDLSKLKKKNPSYKVVLVTFLMCINVCFSGHVIFKTHGRISIVMFGQAYQQTAFRERLMWKRHPYPAGITSSHPHNHSSHHCRTTATTTS